MTEESFSIRWFLSSRWYSDPSWDYLCVHFHFQWGGHIYVHLSLITTIGNLSRLLLHPPTPPTTSNPWFHQSSHPIVFSSIEVHRSCTRTLFVLGRHLKVFWGFISTLLSPSFSYVSRTYFSRPVSSWRLSILLFNGILFKIWRNVPFVTISMRNGVDFYSEISWYDPKPFRLSAVFTDHKITAEPSNSLDPWAVSPFYLKWFIEKRRMWWQLVTVEILHLSKADKPCIKFRKGKTFSGGLGSWKCFSGGLGSWKWFFWRPGVLKMFFSGGLGSWKAS